MMWAHTPIALNSGVFSKHFRKSRAILNDNSFGSRNAKNNRSDSPT